LFVRDEKNWTAFNAQALKALGIDPAEAAIGDTAHKP
jgi:hypothetical protein